MQLLEHNILQHTEVGFLCTKKKWVVGGGGLGYYYTPASPPSLPSSYTAHIQALDSGECSLTMLLVFVQPLVPVLHQQLVLSKRRIDKAIDEG